MHASSFSQHTLICMFLYLFCNSKAVYTQLASNWSYTCFLKYSFLIYHFNLLHCHIAFMAATIYNVPLSLLNLHTFLQIVFCHPWEDAICRLLYNFFLKKTKTIRSFRAVLFSLLKIFLMYSPSKSSVRSLIHNAWMRNGKQWFWLMYDFMPEEFSLLMYFSFAADSQQEAYSVARQFNMIPPVCEQAEYHLFQRDKVEVQLPELYHKIGNVPRQHLSWKNEKLILFMSKAYTWKQCLSPTV